MSNRGGAPNDANSGAISVAIAGEDDTIILVRASGSERELSLDLAQALAPARPLGLTSVMLSP